MGRFGGKSKGGKGIHDQVNPENLYRCKYGLIQDDSSQKYDENSDDVNCQLELEELLDRVINVTAEFDANESRVEVISE